MMSWIRQLRGHLFSLGTLLSLAVLPSPGFAQDVHGVTDNSITIGAWMPLTGPVAIYGLPYRAGAQAYFSMINDQDGVNGRKIRWVVEDNQNNPQQSVTIARKLVTRDDILAVVATLGTPMTAATFPYLLDQEKVPIVFIFGGAVDWYYPPRDGLFGVLPVYEGQAAAVGRWAVRDGRKHILIVRGAAGMYETVSGYAVAAITKANPGAEVEQMPIKIGTTDYAPIALDVKSRNPDAIISIQLQQETVALAKELHQQGASIPIYTWAANVTKSFAELGGKDVEGVKSLSLMESPLAETPAAREYRKALAKYAPDMQPDFQSFMSFGMAKIFVEVVREVKGPLNRETLKASLRAMKDYDSGIFPPVTFSSDRTLGGQSAFPMEVVEGAWKRVGDAVNVEIGVKN